MREAVCTNCGTSSTPLWRKEADSLLCNACGIYLKTHGFQRPLQLFKGPHNHPSPSMPGPIKRCSAPRPNSVMLAAREQAHDGKAKTIALQEPSRRSGRKRQAKWLGEDWCEPDEALGQHRATQRTLQGTRVVLHAASPGSWNAQRWPGYPTASKAHDHSYSDNSDMVSSEMEMNDIDDGGSGSGSGGSTERAGRASYDLHKAPALDCYLETLGDAGTEPDDLCVEHTLAEVAHALLQIRAQRLAALHMSTKLGSMQLSCKDAQRVDTPTAGCYTTPLYSAPALAACAAACSPELCSSVATVLKRSADGTCRDVQGGGRAGEQEAPSGLMQDGSEAAAVAEAAVSDDAELHAAGSEDEAPLPSSIMGAAAASLFESGRLSLDTQPDVALARPRLLPAPHAGHDIWQAGVSDEDGDDDDQDYRPCKRRMSEPLMPHSKAALSSPGPSSAHGLDSVPSPSGAALDRAGVPERLPRPPKNHRGPLVCANCGTNRTPLWRKDRVSGLTMCNACGIYKQTHGFDRPVGSVQPSPQPIARKAHYRHELGAYTQGPRPRMAPPQGVAATSSGAKASSPPSAPSSMPSAWIQGVKQEGCVKPAGVASRLLHSSESISQGGASSSSGSGDGSHEEIAVAESARPCSRGAEDSAPMQCVASGESGEGSDGKASMGHRGVHPSGPAIMGEMMPPGCMGMPPPFFYIPGFPPPAYYGMFMPPHMAQAQAAHAHMLMKQEPRDTLAAETREIKNSHPAQSPAPAKACASTDKPFKPTASSAVPPPPPQAGQGLLPPPPLSAGVPSMPMMHPFAAAMGMSMPMHMGMPGVPMPAQQSPMMANLFQARMAAAAAGPPPNWMPGMHGGEPLSLFQPHPARSGPLPTPCSMQAAGTPVRS